MTGVGATDWERLLAAAAHRLASVANPREADLEAGLVAALAGRYPGRVRQQLTVKPACWSGTVGPADIALESANGAAPTLIEVKWAASELQACSWDAAKLAALLAESQAEAAVLVAGAPRAAWRSGSLGTELFQSRHWSLEDLLARFAPGFAFWREDVANYPKRLPASWSTSALAGCHLLVRDEPWEVRAATVAQVSEAFLPVAYKPEVATWKRGAPPVTTDLHPPPSDGDEIEGDLVARYRSRDEAVAKLGELEQAGRGEGFSASIRSDHQLVWDEGSMRAFLPEDEQPEALVQARAFASPTARRASLARRRILRSSAHPDSLRIETQGAMGSARSDLVWDGDRIHVRLSMGTKERENRVKPTTDHWVRFWRELDRLNVWDWWPQYQREKFATDQPGWSVSIAKGGRLLEARGYAAYPQRGGSLEAPGSEWDSFKAAVRDLSGYPLA